MIKKIGIGLVVLIAMYVVLAMLGPSNYKVERSIKIASAVENVYNQTSIYANWAVWSPFKKADPEAKYELGDDNQKIGGSLSWSGNLSGKGSMTTIKVTPNEKFLYKLEFVEPWYMAMTSSGGFIYEEQEDSVLVTWFNEGDLGFMSRPMVLFRSLEDQIGPQFEQGLVAIKEICENMKPTLVVSEETVESKSILYVSESSSLMSSEIGAKIGAAYGEIMSLVGIAQLEMVGAPMSITRKFSLAEMMVEFDAAIVVDEIPEGLEISGRIEKGDTYAGKALKTVHVGPSTNLKATYDGLIAYIKDNGYEINGNSWEEYIDDPTKVPSEEVRTNIYFPVK
ncbi:MAG: hypothetical protein COB15_06105 [Flavobacteriales bacterium]|nr:MAG: hypothetical protein COB15_06105 [Flavobacteriales bacterium]